MKDYMYCISGLLFLLLAKVKHVLLGYSTPKDFDFNHTEKCVDYDVNVVDNWLEYLNLYSNGSTRVHGKVVLELGPGSDLGTGLYLSLMGADKYYACDVNTLAKHVPLEFYKKMADLLRGKNHKDSLLQIPDDISLIVDKLNYIIHEDFDFASKIPECSIEIVFSQAAFEHFDDIDSVIKQLSLVCKPGAVFVAEIDLMTHSRWIRDVDPNNIYRYNDRVYNMFHFKGIPNRVRPYQYKQIFEKYGWDDVAVIPLKELESSSPTLGLNDRFTSDINQMNILSVMICSRKK